MTATTTTETIYNLILARNAKETKPFLSVHASNLSLRNLLNDLQSRCDHLEADRDNYSDMYYKLKSEVEAKGPSKLEKKQRDKIEQLQDQLNEKLKIEVEMSTTTLNATKELTELKELHKEQQMTISTLREENSNHEQMITLLQQEVKEEKNQSNLTQKQYDGLKDTIRRLQDENDSLSKTNDELVNRIVTEKEKYMTEMNKMMEMNEELQKKVNMLTALNEQEEKRKFWKFGKRSGGNDENPDLSSENEDSIHRKFGDMGILVPRQVKQMIQAHAAQGTCIQYDSLGSDLVATSSEDSTVKIWHTSNGQLKKTFRGGNGSAILGLDINGDTLAGCGTDKMCRIWNMRTERMIHQLVGHSQKITCIRLFQDNKTVISASADRSIKVWDIARNTYRQTLTMRHSSTSNSLDLSTNSITAASGHLDGGVRFWDVRTSERVNEVPEMHIGGVTCVKFSPRIEYEMITLGRDSIIKVTDVRTGGVSQSFYHSNFRVDVNYASCAISPDGKYIAAGSSTTGDIFVWRTIDGNLEAHLKNHSSGVVSVSWGRGGTNGQQVASIDKSGSMILWA